eukprot:scaffold85885_cov26-Tisochrysis_lutea.AAC.1
MGWLTVPVVIMGPNVGVGVERRKGVMARDTEESRQKRQTHLHNMIVKKVKGANGAQHIASVPGMDVINIHQGLHMHRPARSMSVSPKGSEKRESAISVAGLLVLGGFLHAQIKWKVCVSSPRS